MLLLTRGIFICLAISQVIAISVFERLGKRSEERWSLHRTKRQLASVLGVNNRDVLFVLDETVGSVNFGKFVKMTKGLVNSFCGNIRVGKDQTRVGVMTFDSTAKMAINFDDYFSIAPLLSRIDRLRPSTISGKACLANALEFAASASFVSSRGARVGMSKTEGIVILLTQGCDQCDAKALKRASLVLSQQGITMLAFYVTGNDQCVKNMALLNDGSTCYQQYRSTTWSEFDAISASIEIQPCMDAWLIGPPCGSSYKGPTPSLWTEWGQCSLTCGGGAQTRSRRSCSSSGTCSNNVESQKCNTQACPSRTVATTAHHVPPMVLGVNNRDVLFVLDETVGSVNFGKFVKMTKGLVNSFCGNIRIGKDQTRVGVMTFDSTAKMAINFDDYFSKAPLLSRIDRLRPSAIPGKACIANALEFAASASFVLSRGARVGMSKTEGIVILLTQGCDQCDAKALKRASLVLSQQGITMLAFHVAGNDQCVKNMALLNDGSTCYQQYRSTTWSEFDAISASIAIQPCMDAWLIGPPCGSSYKGPTPSLWTEWGQCSLTCGGGAQTRSRRSCSSSGTCSNNVESQKCNTQACPKCGGEWTAWFDRDDETGSGDYEDLSSHRKDRILDVCISPSLVDARVVGAHTNWFLTGNILTMTPSSGLTCVNSKQKNGERCKDYEVRFCCPKIENREEVRFVGETFLRTVLSISRGTTASRSSSTSADDSSEESNCKRRTYSDSSNKIKMLGKDCKSGRRKRGTMPAAPTVTKRDVLFLIDESGSVGSAHFQTFKRLAQAFVNSFCGDINIGENMTRVGVLSFDAMQHVHLNFSETFEKALVRDKIGDISYNSATAGATCLIPSLEYTRQSMFSPARGARIAEPGTEQVLILLSDGCANCIPTNERPARLEELGDSFTQQGVSIITYLVGQHSSSCIEQMEYLINDAHCYQGFLSENWDHVNEQIDKIESFGCSYNWTLTPSC